ncbi:MAG TPA: hypothetical protein VGS22_22825 [Thermoanaerobaculia bacterium]|jgi:hypothetical protein|nr:hypothetical protein [Thermoanaerobaculia bacterium]
MKRTSRKINLHRETVRNLASNELAGEVGAARPLPVSWNCTITQTAPCQAITRVPICIRL